ncbi:MAG: PIG-L family deacetylase [Phycisphaerae bacterium]|nr:PIG-L family deacetylase [Phycisphaerae bacterium]
MSRILICSAHPDDETLGCGGTILLHRQAGDEVVWLIATQAWPPRWDAETVSHKEAEIAAVAGFYQFAEVVRLRLPASRLDELAFGDVLRPVSQTVADVRPDEVYTVHGGDVHGDHQVLAEAVWRSLKPFRDGKGVRRVLSYETLTSTDQAPPSASAFKPTVYRDITSVIDRKIEAMQLYKSELLAAPAGRNAESIRALARVRGAAAGLECAEAFMLLRQIDA